MMTHLKAASTTKRVCTSPEAVERKFNRLMVKELMVRYPHIFNTLGTEVNALIEFDQISLTSTVQKGSNGTVSQRVKNFQASKLAGLRAELRKTQDINATYAVVTTKGTK